MNRQLKFRVYDTLDKRYIKCDEGYQGHYVLSLKGEYYNLQNGSGGKECIVQQYTGLKDKNGVEIYEGDIVEIIYGENLVGEVYFQSTMGTFRVKCNDENSYPLVTYNIEANKLINVVEKVIGNIYEPPELVEQTV